MATESEKSFEENLLKTLVDIGYSRVLINNEKDLISNFRIQLEEFNNIKLSDEEFESILKYLEKESVFEKSKKLRSRYELNRGDGIKYISFLNQKDWCNNIFQVANNF